MSKSKNKIIFDIGVFFICCLSFIFSWIESTVNMDSHHWGIMFSNALDIKRGLIPHKEIFIQHGYLTSLIQSIALGILGEKLLIIGIVTGLFYSLSLFLSYRIFLTFLPKSWSFLSVFSVFLLHGYIIYPWSDYYSYTFRLAALYFFLTKQHKQSLKLFLAGLFLGFSFLARYPSLPAILFPLLFLFTFNISVTEVSKQETLKKFLMLGLGFVAPIIVYFSFLLSKQAMFNLLIQQKIQIAWESKRGYGMLMILLRFFKNILLARTASTPFDLRAYTYTVVFLVNAAVVLYFLRKALLQRQILSKQENIILTICVFSLFGYLDALHLYEIFRLNNAASLGMGILAYGYMRVFNLCKNRLRAATLLPLVTMCCVLMSSVIFKQTSSVYSPWKLDVLMGKGIKGDKISIFQGKFLPKEYYNFYKDIYETISNADSSYYVANFTPDSIAMLVTNRKRTHVYCFYPTYFASIFSRDLEKTLNMIYQKKAIILSLKDLELPGYKVVFSRPFPKEVIPDGGQLYISIPVGR